MQNATFRAKVLRRNVNSEIPSIKTLNSLYVISDRERSRCAFNSIVIALPTLLGMFKILLSTLSTMPFKLHENDVRGAVASKALKNIKQICILLIFFNLRRTIIYKTKCLVHKT